MSRNSPGQGCSAWMASLKPGESSLETFLRSSISSMPFAMLRKCHFLCFVLVLDMLPKAIGKPKTTAEPKLKDVKPCKQRKHMCGEGRRPNCVIKNEEEQHFHCCKASKRVP
ncbi:uncharacterized protein LOC142577912 [Dermacentor variabilis]|uniref:uncharacterized protein LOC142577912 n=1 Tax=Dermacentor variabilis TaxID=34621 RepID=UPI003F5C3A6F